MIEPNNNDWLAVIIGNSRFHWAYFHQKELQQSWDSEDAFIPKDWQHLCLYIASVVDSKTISFSVHPYQRVIQLPDIPLLGVYPTMGIDRALALWGAINLWGYPCLVVDGGTALTFTGADDQGKLKGGAILPGLKIQLDSLVINTASLPRVNLTSQLPERWATNTTDAIRSGVVYTILGGIREFLSFWWQEFPHSPVIFTGGDGEILRDYLIQLDQAIAPQLFFDSNLIFWGIRSIRQL